MTFEDFLEDDNILISFDTIEERAMLRGLLIRHNLKHFNGNAIENVSPPSGIARKLYGVLSKTEYAYVRPNSQYICVNVSDLEEPRHYNTDIEEYTNLML
jgi:hypothetical protein